MSQKTISKNTKISKDLPNNKTLVTFKIDKDLKLRINKLTEDVGVPFSTIVNSLLRQFERTKRFEIDLKHLSFDSSEELDQLLKEGMKGKSYGYESTSLYKNIQSIRSKK